MSLVNQPNILSGEFAAEGDKNTIPANNDGLSGLASIAKGFPPITQQPLAQGGLPPQRQDFNGIFNLISKYLLYAQVGGVYEYNNTLDYQPPCIISYNDKFYACKEANGPSTSAGIQSPTVNDYWDEVIIEFATEAEAEAQSEQNNSKIMTPLRVYQAIVAYFTKFLAAAVFTGIVKAVAPAAASNDNSVPTTSWVRTCITSMLKQIAEILEIQWKAETTGYLLLGPYLGNLKILWGIELIEVAAVPHKTMFPIPINVYFSGSVTPWTNDIPNIVVVPYLSNATTTSVDITLDYEIGKQTPSNINCIYIAIAA